MKRRALVTGGTGQTGSYLIELLLEKDYEVFCLIRRTSNSNLSSLEGCNDRVKFITGDITDQVSLQKAIVESHPNEVYNFAAQSHVVSGVCPALR